MRLRDLFEAPIEDIHVDIDGRPRGSMDPFTPEDARYVTGAKYKNIVKFKLSNTKLKYFLYIIATPETRQHIKIVSTDIAKGISSYIGDIEELQRIDEKLFAMVASNKAKVPDAVHVVLSHNDPESERFQNLTPWMICHRIGHGCLDFVNKGQHAPFSDYTSIVSLQKKMEEFTDLLDTTEFTRGKMEHDVIQNNVAQITNKGPNSSDTALARVFPYKSVQQGKIAFASELLIEMFADYLYRGSKGIRVNYDPVLGIGRFLFEELKQEILTTFQEIEHTLQGRWVTG